MSLRLELVASLEAFATPGVFGKMSPRFNFIANCHFIYFFCRWGNASSTCTNTTNACGLFGDAARAYLNPLCLYLPTCTVQPKNTTFGTSSFLSSVPWRRPDVPSSSNVLGGTDVCPTLTERLSFTSVCANFQRSNIWSVTSSTSYPNQLFWTTGTSLYRHFTNNGTFETLIRIGTVTDQSVVQWTWANSVLVPQVNAVFMVRPDSLGTNSTIQILRWNYPLPATPKPFTAISGNAAVSIAFTVAGASSNKVGWIAHAPVGSNINGTVRRSP